MEIFQDGAFPNLEYHLFQVIWCVSALKNAPSWNISIKSYMMCPNMLKPKYICLFPQKVSFVTVTLPN